MLKQRVLETLKFFDLQDYPLTLLELHRFLAADLESLKSHLDDQGDLPRQALSTAAPAASIDKILECLDAECKSETENYSGFYCLAGRKNIIDLRLENYFYGIRREKLIKKYIPGLRHVPFVRAVALAGSQAMGQEKASSDIDLLIITHRRLLWLTRTLITAYFQIIGKRRHGQKTANRFCLNHYLAGPKAINELRNFYTAAEYLKLRPLVYTHKLWEFQDNNQSWIKTLFPNSKFNEPTAIAQSKTQSFFERIFNGRLGLWLDTALKNWQLPKIRQEKFIVVEEDELSFHPNSKQQELLRKFLF